MKFPKVPLLLAALALVSALPLRAQTSATTIEAEKMKLSSYAIENGNRIKLTAASGNATQRFNGASGTYDMQVYVWPETDGQSKLEVYKGSTLLQSYTYPLGSTETSFVIKNVAVNKGDSLKLVGHTNAGALARVDKIVLSPASSRSTGSTSSTPYSGSPIALPKAFPAVDFDKGGQDVAYNDLTAGNSGGLYRSAEDVDIASTTDSQGGGYKVYSFQTGEWLKYTVGVPSNGLYDLAIRAATTQSSPAGAFHIEVDGVNVTGTITVPNTGGLDTFQWVGKQGVNLTAGTHVLKVVSEQEYFQMDAVSALASSSSTGTTTSTPLTMEAESMTLSSYAVENGSLIVLTAATGSATKGFAGTSGTYDMQVYVVPESDGQPVLEVYKGSTLLQKYTYPLGQSATGDPAISFTIKNVAVNNGDTIKLVGYANAGAWARVDKVVLTPVATDPTIEAETMTLSSYAVENASLIKLTAASGTATTSFSGTSSTYDMDVYIVPESDGQPVLEVYKGSTLLQKYTYPLGKSATGDPAISFTIKGVAVNKGDTIKLAGYENGGAYARVDKIVLSPAGTSSGGSTSTDTIMTTACANPSGGYEGFGRNTTGGAGKSIYHVTNLYDSGSGSLRDALSQGNRCIVFDVAGTISASSNILVKGANITIDGFTAPSPGVTLRNTSSDSTQSALYISSARGASNIIVRGIRVRGAPNDGITIYNTWNIVVDHVSVSGFGDGAIDVTQNSKDVTVQWSILGNGNPSHNLPHLIGYETFRVTSHHNLLIDNDYRHPRCGRDSTASYATDVVCDVRNNLIWNYGGNGTQVAGYGTANIINNYYYTTKSTANTIQIGDSTYGPGSAYVSGNYSQNGWSINGVGTRSTAYSAVAPTTTDAVTAAHDVVGKAGARGPKFGLDSADQTYIGQVSLPQ